MKNSEATKNKQNPRNSHLLTEKYCKDCDKVLPIEEFSYYLDEAGRKRIKFVCKIHELERNRKRFLERRKTDIYFKFQRQITSVIHAKLKWQLLNLDKKSVSEFVNYSINSFINNLELQVEPWMTWDNWGKYNKKTWNDSDSSTWTWQIDHIIPQSDLPYDSITHPNFIKCWSLENLRPLNAKQNCTDGARRLRHR